MIPKGQLIWRCRRGTKELDRLLGSYLHNDYDQAPEHMQQAFAVLLEQQDPDIYDWVMGGVVPDQQELRKIVACLQTNMKGG